MKLQAVNSLNHPAYRDLDRDSARCRVNMNTYRAHLSLGRIGSIVILKITQPKERKEMIVICSLWPDLQNGLLDDEICVTSTIQKSNSGQFSWSDADCEV